MSLIERQAAVVFSGKIALPEELKTKEQVAAVMMYGLELGLRPMTAIRHLYIVKGKVSPSAEVMAGLVLARAVVSVAALVDWLQAQNSPFLARRAGYPLLCLLVLV